MSGFAFPFGNGLQPEAGEMQWTSVFGADEMHHVGLVLQFVQTHADVLLVKRAQNGIVLVIELFGHEDALVAGKRHGFGEARLVHIIDGAPRAVHPVGSGFQYIVLEIVLMEEENALFIGFFCKLLQAHPVPFIGLGKVVSG